MKIIYFFIEYELIDITCAHSCWFSGVRDLERLLIREKAKLATWGSFSHSRKVVTIDTRASGGLVSNRMMLAWMRISAGRVFVRKRLRAIS